MPEELSWGGLVALGASGGLVPCESALVLLLGAIALGRAGLGLLLLLSFSLGLALVLMLIGMLVLYAKNLLPERSRNSSSGFLGWLSIASPAVVMVIGLVMTGVSLGWIQPKWMIG
jgi:ABC-type nickel/cobalt efflux system permease component RcnA